MGILPPLHLLPVVNKVLTCLFAGVALTCSAETVHVVTANLTDGTSVDFKISENPATSFSDEGVRITTSDSEVIYPFDRFAFLTFGVHDTASTDDIARESGRPVFQISGRVVKARNLCAGAAVTVYDVRGSVCFCGKASASGTLSADLSGVPAVVYLLESGVGAFKFILR